MIRAVGPSWLVVYPISLCILQYHVHGEREQDSHKLIGPSNITKVLIRAWIEFFVIPNPACIHTASSLTV